MTNAVPDKGKTALSKINFHSAILSQNQSEFQQYRSSEQSNYGRECKYCGFEFRLNVIAERSTGFKYLRSGCCDVALRKCPNPSELLRCSHLSFEEQDYLKRLVGLPWFSGQVAAVLLQIETKAAQVSAVEVRV